MAKAAYESKHLYRIELNEEEADTLDKCRRNHKVSTAYIFGTIITNALKKVKELIR